MRPWNTVESYCSWRFRLTVDGDVVGQALGVPGVKKPSGGKVAVDSHRCFGVETVWLKGTELVSVPVQTGKKPTVARMLADPPFGDRVPVPVEASRAALKLSEPTMRTFPTGHAIVPISALLMVVDPESSTVNAPEVQGAPLSIETSAFTVIGAADAVLAPNPPTARTAIRSANAPEYFLILFKRFLSSVVLWTRFRETHRFRGHLSSSSPLGGRIHVVPATR